jgi:diguanylate cyclase (GGDEF)-like protein/PAS domain S-box-containing protein
MDNEAFPFTSVLDNLHDGVYLVDRERRITYWNPGAERIAGYSAAEVVGRRCHDGILIHIDAQGVNLCETRCPLAQTLADGRFRETKAYLRHKVGFRLPVSIRVIPLPDGNGVLRGAAEVFSDNTPQTLVMEEYQRLRGMALLDELTGLGNRRYGETHLHSILGEVGRQSWPVGVLFIDIDRFKNVNDAYGHDVGDRVLRLVAKAISGGLRSFDVVCRWGGEEFFAILRHTDEIALRLVAEKIRMLVAASALPEQDCGIRVTISIGATPARESDTPETLVKRADSQMYVSKALGRDRVTVG